MTLNTMGSGMDDHGPDMNKLIIDGEIKLSEIANLPIDKIVSMIASVYGLDKDILAGYLTHQNTATDSSKQEQLEFPIMEFMHKNDMGNVDKSNFVHSSFPRAIAYFQIIVELASTKLISIPFKNFTDQVDHLLSVTHTRFVTKMRNTKTLQSK